MAQDEASAVCNQRLLCVDPLSAAYDFFIQFPLTTSRKTRSFAQRADDAITAARAASPPLPNRITGHLTPAATAALESDEGFLSLDEQGLEDLLQSRGPGKGGLGSLDSDFSDFSDSDEEADGEGKAKPTQEQREERQARRVARKLEGMAGKVEEFVEGRGAVDGAQFSE